MLIRVDDHHLSPRNAKGNQRTAWTLIYCETFQPHAGAWTGQHGWLQATSGRNSSGPLRLGRCSHCLHACLQHILSAPLRSVEVSHCQRTRAAALAGLHPEKVHLGLQQPPQLPCAAANLPERERLQRAAGGEEGPFRRGLWSRFAFDDFSPPHTGPYLPLVTRGEPHCLGTLI